MNREAEKHLDKARGYLAKGEAWYRKAGDEILLARDEGATMTEVAGSLGRSSSWCKKVIAWTKTPASEGSAPTPFAEPGRDTPDVRGAKRILAEAPLEQVEQMIAGLPKSRQTAIRAALGDTYAKARQDEDERVRNLTPAQRKEIEAAKEAISRPVRDAVASFTTLGVVGHLEQATEDLNQMVADQSVTPETILRIDQAHDLFVTELEVARAMAGLERSEA